MKKRNFLLVMINDDVFFISLCSFINISGEDKVSFQIKPFGLFGPGPRQSAPKPVSPPKQEMEGMEEEAKQKVCNCFNYKEIVASMIIRPSDGDLLCNLIKSRLLATDLGFVLIFN
jgi:hypothetical protein